MKVGEAASRVVVQVYHTGQGQDERAHPRPSPLPRGLDSAWSLASNPHRESGTRWRAAADVGQAAGPGRASAPSGEGTLREPFGRLRWSKEGGGLPQVAPFFVSKKPAGSLFGCHMAPKSDEQ